MYCVMLHSFGVVMHVQEVFFMGWEIVLNSQGLHRAGQQHSLERLGLCVDLCGLYNVC
jgi:hypothetical protein